MTDSTHTVRAPQGALAWTAVDGWLYEHEVAPSVSDHRNLTSVITGK
jgi:hypothetical protein